MSSPADPDQKTDPSTRSPTLTCVIDNFISAVDRLSSDESFQGMKDMASYNQELMDNLEKTKTAYNRNLSELAQLQAGQNSERAKFEQTTQEQARKYDKVTEEKATAYRKLKNEQETTNTLRQKIKTMNDDFKRLTATSKKHEERAANLDNTVAELQKQLRSASQDMTRSQNELQTVCKKLSDQSEALAAAKHELASFQSCIVTLTPLRSVKPRISLMLATFFEKATDLFNAFLGHDMDEDQLQNQRCWDRIRDHIAIQRMIPLPASNSAQAKRMRVIAALTIYSRALANRVLQPTYLSLGTGVENALDALPAENPFQDELVRAVLLAVLPDWQKTRRDECAGLVVEEVVGAVTGCVPSDRHASFKSKLSYLTGELCNDWQMVQSLKERVGPCYELEDLSEWQPLPRWPAPTSSGNSPKLASSRQGDKESQPNRQRSEPAALSTGDELKVVWPAFIDNTVDQTEDDETSPLGLILHGYVLTRADAQAAKDEEMSRRTTRRAAREGNATAQKKRRDSAVFLSQGASDGSDVKQTAVAGRQGERGKA